MDSAVDDFSYQNDGIPPCRLPLVYQQRFRRIEDRLRRLTVALKEQRLSSPASTPTGSPPRPREKLTIVLSPNDAPRERPRSIYHKACIPAAPSLPLKVTSADRKYRSPTRARKVPECRIDLSPYLIGSTRPEDDDLNRAESAPRLSVESERILADLHAMDERIANIEREVKGPLRRGTPRTRDAFVEDAAKQGNSVAVNMLPSLRTPTNPLSKGGLSDRKPSTRDKNRQASTAVSESRPPSWRELAASSAEGAASTSSGTPRPSENVLLAPRLDTSHPRPGQIRRIRGV